VDAMLYSKIKYWKDLFAMKKLTVSLEKIDGRDVVHLSGPIYEGSAKVLQPLIEKLGVEVSFNFRNVTTTNTCGIAEWMEFLQVFTQDRHVIFDECPPIIVMLLNMIPFFRRGAVVRSVYRSYFCGDCSKEHWDFLVTGENMPDAASVSDQIDATTECLCRECGKTVFPEVPADEFFGFLKKEA